MKAALMAVALLAPGFAQAGEASEEEPEKAPRKIAKKQKGPSGKGLLKVLERRKAPLSTALKPTKRNTSAKTSRKTSSRSVRIFLKRIRSALPKGWRVRTSRLPGKLQGAALGPAEKGQRPVVTLSLLPALPLNSIERPQVQKALLAALHKALQKQGLDGLDALDEIKLSEGWIEIGARAPAQTQVLRYLIKPGDPSYLLTIIAPRARFQRTYEMLLKRVQKISRVSTAAK